MIRINDLHGSLKDMILDRLEGETHLGKYTINRVSNTHYVAMVINNNCTVAQMVSESGCFITSASRVGDNEICWTVVGMDSGSIKKLMEVLRECGYAVEKTASFLPDVTPTLTMKQEAALKMAFENGYYEIPRKHNIHELCAKLEKSTSSFDVTLRTAEKKIISYYLQNNKVNGVGKKR